MPTKDVVANVTGLMLQPNPLSQVQPGSLKIADNVMLRRTGTLEPANGLTDTNLTGITDANKTILKSFADILDNKISSIIIGSGTVPEAKGLHLQDLSGGGTYYTAVRERDNSTPGRTLTFKPGRSFETVSRDRRIYSCEKAPVTWTRNMADDGDELRISGMQQPGGVNAQTNFTAPLSTVVIAPAGKQAAYRALFYRKYPKYDLFSAPTAPFLYVNDSTDVFSVRVRVNFNDESTPADVGDICIVYRTPFVDIGVDPGDSFRECVRTTLDNTAVNNGQVAMFDLCPDAQLREYLYTNTNREKAEQANYPPPDSRGVATFNDTTFYVANRDWPVLKLGINDFGSINAGGAVGMYNAFNASAIAAGDAHVDFSGDLTGFLTVGMVISQDASTSPIGYVNSVTYNGGTGLTTVSFSNAFGFPGIVTGGPYGPTTHQFWIADSIEFITENYNGSASGWMFWYQFDDPYLIPYTLAAFNAQVRGIVVSTLTVPEAPGVNLTFTQNQTGRFKSFTISVTHGDAYTQLDSVVGGVGMKASTQNVSTSRLYYSKTSLPEAVPPGNYEDVGHGEIYRIISDSNSLYAFCSDGIYRLTGSGNDWTIVQLSRTHKLVHPDAVCTLGGTIFGWFSEGVCTVSENGAQNISQDAISPELNLLLDLPQDSVNQWYWGTFMVSDEIEREVYLNVARYFWPDQTWQFEKAYVVNANTSTWVNRPYLQAQSGLFVPGSNTLYFGKNANAGTTLPTMNSENSSLAKPPATVVFNELTAGGPGVLKQWVDVNLLAEDVRVGTLGQPEPRNCKVQFLFNDDIPSIPQTSGYRYASATSFLKEHCWVPRRCSVLDTLTVGFTSLDISSADVVTSIRFKLYGIVARYRVASETFQK